MLTVEIRGQKGRISWEYQHDLTWEEIADNYDEGVFDRYTGGNYNYFEQSGFIGTLAKWEPFDYRPKFALEPPEVGTALCVPYDRFCKETGRKLSLTRLLDNLNLSREERRKIWEAYHNRKSNGKAA